MNAHPPIVYQRKTELKNTFADALNNWSATGTDCAMTDSYVQDVVKNVGYGEHGCFDTGFCL